MLAKAVYGLALVRGDLRDTLLLATVVQEQDVTVPEEVLDGHLELPGLGPADLLLPLLVRQLSLLAVEKTAHTNPHDWRYQFRH